MQKLLECFLVIFFGGTEIYHIVAKTLYMIGLWKLLEKCGEKGWKALVPYYRFYTLAKCANRSSEGLCYLAAGIVVALTDISQILYDVSDAIQLFQTIVNLVADLVRIVYALRVFVGLCEFFQRKRGWSILWALVEFIPALIWGFSPKFQPQWTLSDIDASVDTYFSNAHADVMKEGLAVNLEERTATESFKKKTLLRDIHMNIQPGHMVLLLGGSGAGKTTLINAINGYEKAKAEIHLNGTNVYTNYKQMQYQIGFVPQLDLMRGNDTVLHTLYDAAALRLPSEFTREDRRERVRQVMEIFGLQPVKDNLVSKLSGGQRKRLSIAMEFISNPSLFILDEPDSGLDGVMARSLMEQLRAIADQGKIVIVITHTPDRVIDLFDDVIVLAKDKARTGRLAYFGPIKEARDFFERDTMEHIVRSINRQEEGGEGLADEFIKKFAEVQHG